MANLVNANSVLTGEFHIAQFIIIYENRVFIRIVTGTYVLDISENSCRDHGNKVT